MAEKKKKYQRGSPESDHKRRAADRCEPKKTIRNKDYEKALNKLQIELVKLQRWVQDKGLRVVVHGEHVRRPEGPRQLAGDQVVLVPSRDRQRPVDAVVFELLAPTRELSSQLGVRLEFVRRSLQASQHGHAQGVGKEPAKGYKLHP